MRSRCPEHDSCDSLLTPSTSRRAFHHNLLLSCSFRPFRSGRSGVDVAEGRSRSFDRGIDGLSVYRRCREDLVGREERCGGVYAVEEHTV